MNSFQEISDAIKNYKTFYLTGHINPDGDSIGSVNALSLALKALGKTIVEGKAECFIQLDVQPEYRLSSEAKKIKEDAKFTICFDHHQADDSKCNMEFIDAGASANALIIWDFIKFLDIEINEDMATAAYYGLCSDTNSFRNTNSDKRSFDAAAEMMSYGVNASKVAQELFQSRSLASFGLEQIVLEHLFVDNENRFAFSYLTYENYDKFNATKDDSDAMIDLLRELECVDVACVIRQEKEDEKIKGSLRSKTECDVSKLARKHTGGGHKAASGFTMDETNMEEAIDIVKRQLVSLMQGKI